MWPISLLLLAAVDLSSVAEAVAQEFAQGHYTAVHARLKEEVRAKVPAAALGSATAQFGAFERYLGPPRVETKGTLRVFTYPTQFARAKMALRITLQENSELAGFFITHLPAEATGLAVVTGTYRLPAELARPKGSGPFPAVVLVHGSGPQDRDETIGPNKPFKDLAEGLATRGIAVLRYEKRTRQYPTAVNADFGLDAETVDDAVSAVALLAKQPGVNPKRVFVLGHSQGALAAPRIGQRAPVAGLILLASFGRPFREALTEQLANLGQPASAVDRVWAMFTPAYQRDVTSYDPIATARTLQVPLLVLQGERDYQVTMADFAGWKKALSADRRVTLKSYPKLNHLFLEGTGRSTPAEYSVASHIPAYVLDDLAAWVTSITSR